LFRQQCGPSPLLLCSLAGYYHSHRLWCQHPSRKRSSHLLDTGQRPKFTPSLGWPHRPHRHRHPGYICRHVHSDCRAGPQGSRTRGAGSIQIISSKIASSLTRRNGASMSTSIPSRSRDKVALVVKFRSGFSPLPPSSDCFFTPDGHLQGIGIGDELNRCRGCRGWRGRAGRMGGGQWQGGRRAYHSSLVHETRGNCINANANTLDSLVTCCAF
jgi:hypothetical protein